MADYKCVFFSNTSRGTTCPRKSFLFNVEVDISLIFNHRKTPTLPMSVIIYSAFGIWYKCSIWEQHEHCKWYHRFNLWREWFAASETAHVMIFTVTPFPGPSGNSQYCVNKGSNWVAYDSLNISIDVYCTVECVAEYYVTFDYQHIR